MSIVERIKQIIEYKNISARKFCINIGVANGFLDKVKDVGSEKVTKILDTYPDISPEWLLMGKGEMLRGDSPSMVEKEVVPLPSECKACKDKEERIKELTYVIDTQRELITMLKKEKKPKEATVYDMAAEPELKTLKHK